MRESFVFSVVFFFVGSMIRGVSKGRNKVVCSKSCVFFSGRGIRGVSREFLFGFIVHWAGPRKKSLGHSFTWLLSLSLEYYLPLKSLPFRSQLLSHLPLCLAPSRPPARPPLARGSPLSIWNGL